MSKRLFLFVFLLGGAIGMRISAQCVIADYPFDGNALDVSGNGNDGTIVGATTTTDRFGQANSAYEFNGMSSYIDLNNNFDLPERTINLWVWVDDLVQDDAHIYISDNPSLSHGFTQVICHSTQSDTSIRTAACRLGAIGSHNSPIMFGNWHMITIAVDSDSVRHYFDAKLVYTSPIGSQISTSGGHGTALLGTSRLFDRYFKGKIDDVTIYDCAISPVDIANLFTSNDIAVSEQIKIAPTLTTNFIQVEGDNLETLIFEFYDINGKYLTPTFIDGRIDVSDLADGVYILLIRDAQHSHNLLKKIVKI